MLKFRGKGQILRLGWKFRSQQKTVGPTDTSEKQVKMNQICLCRNEHVPVIIEKNALDVRDGFTDDWYKVDAVSVRRDAWTVALHQVLHVLLNVVHLQVLYN